MHATFEDPRTWSEGRSQTAGTRMDMDDIKLQSVEEHNTEADFQEMYSQKAASYDTFRAPAPGLSKILGCLSQSAKGLDILDLGCGTGSFFKHLHALEPRLMVGIDPNEAMVDKAKAKAIELTGSGDWVLSGFSDVLDSHSFDLIFCGQVIQNLTPDPSEAPAARARFYAEMMRILKPGGRVVLTTRLVPSEGRLSDLYWYADPAVVPQAVESMESVVPKDPKMELELAGFADVSLHAAAADDTIVDTIVDRLSFGSSFLVPVHHFKRRSV